MHLDAEWLVLVVMEVKDVNLAVDRHRGKDRAWEFLKTLKVDQSWRIQKRNLWTLNMEPKPHHQTESSDQKWKGDFWKLKDDVKKYLPVIWFIHPLLLSLAIKRWSSSRSSPRPLSSLSSLAILVPNLDDPVYIIIKNITMTMTIRSASLAILVPNLDDPVRGGADKDARLECVPLKAVHRAVVGLLCQFLSVVFHWNVQQYIM